MKKLLFAIALAAVSCGVIKAQNEMPKNDISVNYGFATHNEFIDAATSIVSSGGVSYDKTSGNFGLQYIRNVSPKWGIGLAVGYEQMKGAKGWMQEGIDPKLKSTDIIVMPVARHYWFNNRTCGGYTKVGLGASFCKDEVVGESKSVVDVAFQVSAFGIEAGSQTFRVFAEAGYGYQGLLQAGLRCRF